jgi:hypothetical protein
MLETTLNMIIKHVGFSILTHARFDLFNKFILMSFQAYQSLMARTIKEILVSRLLKSEVQRSRAI